MQLSVQVNLALCNVPSQIRYWMSYVIIWHGQYWELSNGSVLALDSSSSLIYGWEISIHVSRIGSSSRNLFSGGWDLLKSIGILRHVGHDNQHMHLLLIGQILCSCQGQSWRDYSLNCWIWGLIHEQSHSFHGSVLLKVCHEEPWGLFVHTHGCKDYGKVLIRVIMNVLVLDQRSLSAKLSSNLIVRKTIGWEQRYLLSSGYWVHDINCWDSCLNHFLGIDSVVGIYRHALNVQEILCKNVWTMVNGHPRAIEDSSKNLLRYRHLENISCKLHMGVDRVYSWRAFENLDYCFLAIDLKDLSFSLGAIWHINVDYLSILWELDVVQDHQRTIHLHDCSVVDSRGYIVVSNDCLHMSLVHYKN